MNKGFVIEQIENMYGLASNYLKTNNNLELKNLLKELELLEDKIEICEDIDLFKNYNILLNNLIDRIEVIINE